MPTNGAGDWRHGQGGGGGRGRRAGTGGCRERAAGGGARAAFTTQAANYAASAVVADRERRRAFAARAAPPPARVLDVATGPAFTALAFAAAGASLVLGVDLTPAMLGEARRARDAAGLRALHFALGEATALPVASGAFDVVTCGNAVHHFAAPLPPCARCAAPAGRAARSRSATWSATRTRSGPPRTTPSSGCATPRTSGPSRRASWRRSWSAWG